MRNKLQAKQKNDPRHTCKATRSFAASERGNITIPFAFMLVALVFFIGLATDISMVLLDHGRLNNLCQVVSNNRHTHMDTLRFSDNPAEAAVEYVANTLQENHFSGQATVDFEESARSTGHRHIQVTLNLSCDSPLYFLKIFGADSITVHSQTTFEDDYGENGDDVVWAPSMTVDSYNGHYTVDL